ncbi:hypothetical protein B0H13DRAFT_2308362 [Mycena leptocephala]|nr:hypothetical protein B0H13DRAFT_2308362 [Mycena leptocephala]
MNVASFRLQTAVHQNKILNAGLSSSNSSSNHLHKNSHGPRNNHRTASPIANPTHVSPRPSLIHKATPTPRTCPHAPRPRSTRPRPRARPAPSLVRTPSLHSEPSPMYAPMDALRQPGPHRREITGNEAGTGSASANTIESENIFVRTL